MKPTQETQDRRRTRRKRQQTKIVLRVAGQELEGSAENISSSGALFHTDEGLRVEVEVEADGEVKILHGRLIRTERVSSARQSWAVEFDA